MFLPRSLATVHAIPVLSNNTAPRHFIDPVDSCWRGPWLLPLSTFPQYCCLILDLLSKKLAKPTRQKHIGAIAVDPDELVELVACDLTQSISRMLIEMGSEDGQRFAEEALIEFATQALNGASRVGSMNISTFTQVERHALAQASTIVLVTLQADTSRPQ